jgi:hypothetical protein
MHYFPNFDSTNNGLNALVHYIESKTNPTWYNRYRYDTTNMFAWGGSASPSMSADFNGDGARDYYDEGNKSFYVGKKNGSPPFPDALPSYYDKVYGSAYIDRTKICDINNDGKADVIIGHTSKPEKQDATYQYLGTIIFGNADLTKMRVVALPRSIDRYQCLVDAYTVSPGKARLIVWTWDNDKRNNYYNLWELALDTSGNVKQPYKVLERRLMDPNNEAWYLGGTMFFHLNNNTQHTMRVSSDVYALDNDKMEFLFREPYIGAGGKLDYSLADKNKPGWFYGREVQIGDTLYDLCAGGNPQTRCEPFARMLSELHLANNEIAYADRAVNVGDVNGDGVGDLAVKYGAIFRIYLGVVGTVGVNDKVEKQTIDMIFTNPIHLNSPTHIRVSSPIESAATIEVYDLLGRKLSTLWEGVLQNGVSTIPLDIRLNPLPPGMYNLRLKAANVVVDKALIIE